jgi:hypothetical protein
MGVFLQGYYDGVGGAHVPLSPGNSPDRPCVVVFRRRDEVPVTLAGTPVNRRSHTEFTGGTAVLREKEPALGR